MIDGSKRMGKNLVAIMRRLTVAIREAIVIMIGKMVIIMKEPTVTIAATTTQMTILT